MLLFERSSVLTYSTGHLNTRVAVPCIIINVHVKVSSLPLVSGSAPPEYEDLHPLIKRVHAAYGAERLMWASDQTQTMGKNRGTYAQNADIIRKYAAAYLPAADVQMMMHGTATRVFKWPVE
jgi:predicted TIM-barrel fold metal-dependent hydrolase